MEFNKNDKNMINKDNDKKIETIWHKIFHNEAVVIAAIYGFFGVLWILSSDRILESIFSDIDQYKSFQTIKGWFYILITTIMVYLLIRNRMVLLKNEIHNTMRAYEELNITHCEMLHLEEELADQRRLTDNIIYEAPVAIVIHTEDEIISSNPYAMMLSGYSKEELNEVGWMKLLIPQEHREELQAILNEIRIEKKFKKYESSIIAKDGTGINILWNSNLLAYNLNEEKQYFVSFGTDICERKRYEEKVKRLAYYDSLTGLPNRAMFESEVNKHIDMALSREKDCFIIAYLDIDNFKMINDSMGHQFGDVFLTYFAERLKHEVIEPDVIARLGGDEFAILFNNPSNCDVMDRIENIRQHMTKTWSIENRQFFISMSIGVVAYPEDGHTSSELLKNADIAMYRAKREGKNRILFYEEKIQEDGTKHVQMINNLQYGIEEEQFELYYQPQFNLITEEIIGVEALVRWKHPKEGFISPGVFIPLAEETGQIYELERWIIKRALEQKKLWEDMGFHNLVLSINLSGKTLTSDINFEEMDKILDKVMVDYSKVVIEITETADISDMDYVIRHLKTLKMRGIRIALDDFGTGYSSLNYLKMFPINIIKLDKSFIDAIHEEGIDTLLIKNILTLAKDLKYEVTAEGIETKEQMEYLRRHACETGQGFLFSKPLPETQITQLLLDKYRYQD